MNQVLSSCSVSISELKKNPSALLLESEGSPIAILNHNKPTAYLIPAETYEWLLDRLEDAELAIMIKERTSEKAQAIDVNIDDL